MHTYETDHDYRRTTHFTIAAARLRAHFSTIRCINIIVFLRLFFSRPFFSLLAILGSGNFGGLPASVVFLLVISTLPCLSGSLWTNCESRVDSLWDPLVTRARWVAVEDRHSFVAWRVSLDRLCVWRQRLTNASTQGLAFSWGREWPLLSSAYAVVESTKRSWSS